MKIKRLIVTSLMAGLCSTGCLLSTLAHAAELKIVVKKQARTLQVFSDGQVIKHYKIALGFDPVGTKTRQGDGKTPEGTYYVRVKNPQSQFYRSLGVNYPNASDAEHGLKEGLISKAQYDSIVAANKKGVTPLWNTRLGGEIFIHGGGTGRDWTFGCIALDNKDMQELFDMIQKNTEVVIQK